MPFTPQQIEDAGKTALDFYLKNNPIDQIATERPLLKKLMGKKKTFPGAKQYVVEQLRHQYQSNFQWFRGNQAVTYNQRQTIEQAQFPWYSAHDGLSLDEDRLVQNGISLIEEKAGAINPKASSKAERMMLTNLFEEQMEVLKLGFEEKFDQALHIDGTANPDSVTGLDALISLDPTVGTVGGIDRATNVWWRNHVATGLTATPDTGDILENMEKVWRACTRNGGKPDTILVGEDFIDGFREYMLRTYGRINYGGVQEKNIEGGTNTLSFHGVEFCWDPVFQDLDDLYAPAVPWQKRCYFINSKHLTLRPVEGQDMVTRKPPRPYDRYEFYWGLTWRGSLTMNRSNAHAVLSLA